MITKMMCNLLFVTRNKEIKLDSAFSVHDLVAYAFNKGGMSVLRGILAKCFLNSSSGLFFVGKSTRILHKKHLSVGKNCYIGDFGYLNCISRNGVKLGDNVTIREYAWLQLTSNLSAPGEGIVIGDGTYIGPRVILGAGASLSIGKRCQIGAGVNFIAENHNFAGGEDIFNQGVSRKGINIGDDCWIGNNVVILDGVTIGKGVVIGAGAIVTKDFPDNVVILGNPARVLKTR